MKNVILYVRVSTDEQADRGFSLRDQEEKLVQYCRDNNYHILKIYKEDYSAKTFNRPEFTKLLAYCKTNASKIDELLFLKWDRFSRNTAESYNKINFFNNLNIRPNAISQPLDLSIPEQGLMLAVYLSIPEVENQRRSQNVTAGMRRAFKEGRYVGAPPKGYSVGRDSSKKPILVPNKDARHIKTLFELFSTGTYNLKEVHAKLKKKGFSSSSSAMSRIIRNPLYCGIVPLKAYKEEPAAMVEGIHEPLVTKKMFYEAQEILEGRKKQKGTNHKKVNPKFPLRGFIMCPSCNKPLSASTSRGRNNSYSYYHCFSPCSIRIRVEDAHAWFTKFLKGVALTKESYELLMELIKEEFEKFQKSSQLGPKHYEQKEKLTSKLHKIQDLFIEGDLSKEDYQITKMRYSELLNELKEKEAEVGDKKEILEKYKKDFKKMENIDNQFFKSEIELQRSLLGSIFSKNFQFENNRVRTADINPLLFKLTKYNKGYRRAKKKGQVKKNDLSQMVLEVGIEPTLQRNWILNPARLPIPPLDQLLERYVLLKLEGKSRK